MCVAVCVAVCVAACVAIRVDNVSRLYRCALFVCTPQTLCVAMCVAICVAVCVALRVDDKVPRFYWCVLCVYISQTLVCAVLWGGFD